jgi:hypothetical protein
VHYFMWAGCFISFLQGGNTKMSASSDPNSAIYVTDSSNQIKEKVWPELCLIRNNIYPAITRFKLSH